MDKAREKTDQKLNSIERRIRETYKSDPALLRIQKKYNKYMADVNKRTQGSYKAFVAETNHEHKEELKRAYMNEIKDLTINNRQYKAIVSEFTRIMADVNQKSLDVVNAEMTDIYVLNYNQISDVCRKVGIEVDEN